MASIFSSSFYSKKPTGKQKTNKVNSLETIKAASTNFPAVETSFDQALEERSKKSSQEKVLFTLNKVKEEERIIYDQEKRQTEKEIALLQEEIAHLVQTAEKLEKHIEVAAEKSVVNPNIYDISFIIKLKIVIKHFLERAEDAAIWLEAVNGKAKKKGFFWSKFANKGGGGQFLLSPDSYVSRSAG